MTFSTEEFREILSIFKAESEEHLQKLNECLPLLEKEPERVEVIEEIFREAHSLKGSARMIGFEAVEKLAHRLEDIFGAAKKLELKLRPAVFDVIFEVLDSVDRITKQWLSDPKGGVEDVSDILGKIEEVLGKKEEREDEKAGEQEVRRDRKAATAKARAGKKRRTDGEGRGKPRKGVEDVAKTAPVPAMTVADDRAAPTAGSATDDAQEAVKLEVEETIRVTTQKLDDLMNQIGEILVTKIKFDQRLSEVRRIERALDDVSRGWANVQRQFELKDVSPSPNTVERLVQMQSETGTKLSLLQEDFNRFATSFNDDSLRMTLISGELQESINRVRMLPLSSLFNLFPRLLRDIVRGEGKKVELKMEGGVIQLDKRIIEQLKDPLMHLLRNSIDHGIETPEERTESGKSPVGTITLRAEQKASSVLIEIEDDGAGLDLERIKKVGSKKGFIIEKNLAEMTEQQILALVFRPGFSTKGIITDLSGRGVGLDVVFNNIEQMKGKISLFSEKKKGAKFSIELPVSLATSQALLVKVNGHTYAVPLTAVEIISEIGVEEVMTLESREAILVGGVPTALVRLSEILGLPTASIQLERDSKVPVVVISSAEEKVAILVTEVLGEKEIVVKHLGSQLRRVKNVSGATIMGDGGVVLILNVFDLIKSSQKARGMWLTGEKKEVEHGERRPEVLVVDDSVTTRVLEKNILEGSGYNVTLAVDGRDALDKVRAGSFDIVVSDIEMPRMDGFELTMQLRKDEKFQQLPVILVTSLESPEDKKKGVEAGADAYIIKGSFDQGNLLATIKQLL